MGKNQKPVTTLASGQLIYECLEDSVKFKYTSRITILSKGKGSKFCYVSGTSETNLNELKIPREYTVSGIDNGQLFSENSFVIEIASNAFKAQQSLTSVILPNTIAVIGDEAFNNKVLVIFYEGTKNEWEKISIGNSNFAEKPLICYYSESKPTEEGRYWHYVNEKPAFWTTTVVNPGDEIQNSAFLNYKLDENDNKCEFIATGFKHTGFGLETNEEVTFTISDSGAVTTDPPALSGLIVNQSASLGNNIFQIRNEIESPIQIKEITAGKLFIL